MNLHFPTETRTLSMIAQRGMPGGVLMSVGIPRIPDPLDDPLDWKEVEEKWFAHEDGVDLPDNQAHTAAVGLRNAGYPPERFNRAVKTFVDEHLELHNIIIDLGFAKIPRVVPRHLEHTHQYVPASSRRDFLQYDRPAPGYAADEALSWLGTKVREAGKDAPLVTALLLIKTWAGIQTSSGYQNPNWWVDNRSGITLSFLEQWFESRFGYSLYDADPLITNIHQIESILEGRFGDMKVTIEPDRIASLLSFFDLDLIGIPMSALQAVTRDEITSLAYLATAYEAATDNLVGTLTLPILPARVQNDPLVVREIIEDLYLKAGVHPEQIPTMTINQINSILVQHGIRPLLIPRVGSAEWDDYIPDNAIVAALLGITVADLEVIEAAYPGIESYETYVVLAQWTTQRPLTVESARNTVADTSREVGLLASLVSSNELMYDRFKNDPILDDEAVLRRALVSSIKTGATVLGSIKLMEANLKLMQTIPGAPIQEMESLISTARDLLNRIVVIFRALAQRWHPRPLPSGSEIEPYITIPIVPSDLAWIGLESLAFSGLPESEFTLMFA